MAGSRAAGARGSRPFRNRDRRLGRNSTASWGCSTALPIRAPARSSSKPRRSCPEASSRGSPPDSGTFAGSAFEAGASTGETSERVRAKTANRGKDAYLAAQDARLRARRGANEATIAVCHSIRTAACICSGPARPTPTPAATSSPAATPSHPQTPRRPARTPRLHRHASGRGRPSLSDIFSASRGEARFAPGSHRR
jgi:hypothetical protein